MGSCSPAAGQRPTDNSPTRKPASSYSNHWTDCGPRVPGSRAQTSRPLRSQGPRGRLLLGGMTQQLHPIQVTLSNGGSPRPPDGTHLLLAGPLGCTALPTGPQPCHVPPTAPADTKGGTVVPGPSGCLERLRLWNVVQPVPPTACQASSGGSNHSSLCLEGQGLLDGEEPSEERVPLWPLYVTQPPCPCSSHREPGGTDGGDNEPSDRGGRGTMGHELCTLSSGATEEMGREKRGLPPRTGVAGRGVR